MTCRQKLILDHLDWPFDEYEAVTNRECPNHYGYLPTPLDKNGNFSCADYDCDACWDREIPGTATIEDVRRALNDLL